MPAGLGDALAAHLLRMPVGRSRIRLVRNLPVPMRDGMVLLTDLHVPDGPGRGTLLVRTPYGRRGPVAALTARFWATHGYRVVNQSCRGTDGSGGVFEPFRRERADGEDTVAWLRRQNWFDGRFAVYGTSYLGYAAWALMVEPPPELVAAVISVTAHDNHRVAYDGGAFALGPMLDLFDGLGHLDEPLPALLLRTASAGRRWRRATTELPVMQAAAVALGRERTPFRTWLETPDRTDPLWAEMDLGEALDRVRVPVLLHDGWQDPFVEQMLEQYARLHRRGVDVALTIGPWTHLQTGTRAVGELARETLDWLAAHLDARPGAVSSSRTAPVRLWMSGAERWLDLASWPPPTRELTLRLQQGGGLDARDPDPTAAPTTFRYDPADPTPSVGGRVIDPARTGRRDNRRLERRADVITFTTAPLDRAIEVVGSPVVELVHRSDHPHVDVFARLCQVTGTRSVNLSDGFRRLGPGVATGPVELRLETLAHRFEVGTRIRLQLSGGAHPRWMRNLGTGGNPATDTTTMASERAIGHGDSGSSLLRLPVIDSR